MRTRYLLFLLVPFLNACSSKQYRNDGTEVLRRPHAYQDQDIGDHATISVSRDSSALGGGCAVGLFINEKFAGSFTTRETVNFYVPSGTYTLTMTKDPFEKFFCRGYRVYAESAPKLLAAGESATFVLHLSFRSSIEEMTIERK
jgi:hypothetical protein